MINWICPNCWARRDTEDDVVVYQCGCGGYMDKEVRESAKV